MEGQMTCGNSDGNDGIYFIIMAPQCLQLNMVIFIPN